MGYYIYKMRFPAGVHLGTGTQESSSFVFSADTLFSALCHEAIKVGKLDELLSQIESDRLRFSDAMPFEGERLFVPKPFMRIERSSDDVSARKLYKNLKYIDVDNLSVFVQGEFDIHGWAAPRIGRHYMKTSAAIRGNEETVPYRIGAYYFYSGSGLYLIARAEDPSLLEELLESLSYVGIGGRRADGVGRFELIRGKGDQGLIDLLDRDPADVYMTLSLCLPGDDELGEVLDGADYMLAKRSGFVASDSYAEEYHRKKDLYVFQAGSCFRKKFRGVVADVSDGGTHAVSRYAKPLFIGVK